MREGAPSETAQRVAAYRLGFSRRSASFGDPDSDDRLAQDVAAPLDFTPSERMARYLERRTAFFDRVVLGALERGAGQIAVIGAGYDGRALRYAKSGVRWFEIDHSSTQADKRRRLERLGIATGTASFLALDLAGGGVAAALKNAGWESDALSLMLCEGVAVYLEADVLEGLLTDLRTVATVGTRLAISLAPDIMERVRFRASVAAMGEPARNSLSDAEVASMLTRARWRAADISERAQRAGFTLLAPAWELGPPGTPATAGRIGGYLDQVWGRRGIDRLAGHLSETYRIEVTGTRELDVGVVRVTRSDGKPWVARVFQAARPPEAAEGDAEILRFLADRDFPAERLAHPTPISTLEGQAVLVTEFIDGGAMKGGEARYRLLGETLGRLVTLAGSDAIARPGGAWHHLLFQGNPTDEVTALQKLIDAAGPRVPEPDLAGYEAVRAAAAGIEDCAGLPEALIHPDVVPPNVKLARDGSLTLVDWTGAGRGPRLWPLAFLLWSAGIRHAQAAMTGYLTHAELEPPELERLPEAVAARPVVFECWMFATGRKPLPDVVRGLALARSRAATIAAGAHKALS